MLLNFRRTNVTTKHCTFPGCGTPNDRLRRVKYLERSRALKMKNIYIFKDAKLSRIHQSENSWNVDMKEENMAFTRKQIKDLITLFTETVKEVQNEIQNPPVGPENTNTMETYIGLSADQFEDILRVVLPSLLGIYKNLNRTRSALYTYLMKLRTGFTNRQIAPLLNIRHSLPNCTCARSPLQGVCSLEFV